jgi:Cdc6-like AAA superfamily ATPase
MIQKLIASQLRRTYDPLAVPLSTEEVPHPAKAIIGQERAVRALQFGLGNKGHGFNIYVAGVPGTGKQTAVMHFLKDLAKNEPSPCDWCYVNNFQDPYYPKKLSLPKGQAHGFRNDIRHFLLQANSALIKIFESDEFSRKRDEA